MSTLRQMHDILNGNNNKPEEKRVTFAESVRAPRVSATQALTSAAKQHSFPRFPRVATAQIEKPIGQQSNDTPASRTRSRMRIDAMETTDLVAAMSIMERQLSSTTDEQANAIFDAKTNTILKYRKLISHPDYQVAWNTSSANEFGRLAQGVGDRIKGTDTIFFVHKHDIPLDQRWHDTSMSA